MVENNIYILSGIQYPEYRLIPICGTRVIENPATSFDRPQAARINSLRQGGCGVEIWLVPVILA